MPGRFIRRSSGLALAVSLAVAAAAQADDLDTLYARYQAQFYASTSTPSESETNGYITSLGANGTWSDIDLSLREQVNWTPIRHLDRLSLMAKSFADKGGPLQGNAALGNAISKAVDAYIKQDPASTNWWFNEIGAQLSLGPFLFLMGSRLTPAQAKGMDAIMARSWKSAQRTGENLVWISRATLWRAVLDHDAALAKSAVDAIAGTMTITTGEGIQRDFSFYQHGPQLYNGGYGNAFSSDAGSIAYDLRGTNLQFAPAILDVITGYFLNGQRWMVRGGAFDHSVRGREITRSGSGSAGSLAAAATKLAEVVPSPAAAQDLTAMAAGIAVKNGSSVTGDRWFWRCEYLAHHRKGYFISVRMASKRLNASEVVNQEGLLSRYLSDGASLVYRSGREYDAIFPVWDWCRIPGVTVAHASQPPVIPAPNQGAGDFAGGISDGTFGGTAFDYDKLGVKARKAWFLFDREMVALGAGISATADGAVQTTLNQCLLNGPVMVATGSAAALAVAEFTPGSKLGPATLWILHDSVGYAFPAGREASLAVGNVSGSWRRINSAQSAAAVDKDVFSLWLDHGVKPANGGYQYVTLMGVTAGDMAAYAKAPSITVLANTADLQAARHKDLAVTQAVFYKPGSLAIDSRFTLSPDRPCMLLVREYLDRMDLFVSDPKHGIGNVVVKADVKLTGPGAVWSEAGKSTTVTFVLPSGDSAGAVASGSFGAVGVAVRPAAKTPGLRVSALRSGNGGITVTYTLPGEGPVRLALLDASGHERARSDAGRLAAGSHAWAAGSAPAKSAGKLWVRLEWRGRSLLAPVDAGETGE